MGRAYEPFRDGAPRQADVEFFACDSQESSSTSAHSKCFPTGKVRCFREPNFAMTDGHFECFHFTNLVESRLIKV